jgi:glutamate dehydrogenase (NADP+)
MSQNSLRLSWTAEEVDEKLKRIMSDIHESCVTYGTEENGFIDYVKGAKYWAL